MLPIRRLECKSILPYGVQLTSWRFKVQVHNQEDLLRAHTLQPSLRPQAWRMVGACQCSKPKPPNHLGLDNTKQQCWETGHSSESGVEDNSLLYFLWTVEWSNTRQSGTSHQGLNFAVDTMGRCFDVRLTILARERQSRMNFGKPYVRSTLPSGASTPQSNGRQERSGFYPRF